MHCIAVKHVVKMLCKFGDLCNGHLRDFLAFQITGENSQEERDVYEELLTQAEIQGNVNKVNCESASRSRGCRVTELSVLALLLPFCFVFLLSVVLLFSTS